MATPRFVDENYKIIDYLGDFQENGKGVVRNKFALRKKAAERKMNIKYYWNVGIRQFYNKYLGVLWQKQKISVR